MLTQTIGRFENTDDLIDWLKSFGYEKVLRTFPDGVILESEEENALVFRKDNLVAFSPPLEECDLECADKENSLEPLEDSSGSGSQNLPYARMTTETKESAS